MPLAFAIANSCGEAGRSFFHRLCSLSEKYRQVDADKLYDHTLQNGERGQFSGNGVPSGPIGRCALRQETCKLAKFAAPSHTHTHVRARGRGKRRPETDGKYRQSATGCSCGKLRLAALFSGIPVAALSSTGGMTRRMLPPKGIILLLGALTVFGATLNRLLSFTYGRKVKYPCLQTFVIAPPASGKGALTWVRRLAEPCTTR